MHENVPREIFSYLRINMHYVYIFIQILDTYFISSLYALCANRLKANVVIKHVKWIC